MYSSWVLLPTLRSRSSKFSRYAKAASLARGVISWLIFFASVFSAIRRTYNVCRFRTYSQRCDRIRPLNLAPRDETKAENLGNSLTFQVRVIPIPPILPCIKGGCYQTLSDVQCACSCDARRVLPSARIDLTLHCPRERRHYSWQLPIQLTTKK